MSPFTTFRRRMSAALLSIAGIVAVLGHASIAQADTLENVRKAGVIRVAVPQDYAPFGSVGSDMQLHGYDVEVAKLTAAGLHVKLQIVPVTMANKIPYLVTNKVDLVLNLGKNPQRAEVIDFTAPYAPYYTAVFGPQAEALPDVGALIGKKIGVVTGSQEDLFITKNAPPGTLFSRYQDNSSAVAGFLSGQTDFLATGNIVGAKLLADNPQKHFAQKLLLMNSPVCAAVRKGDAPMLEAVNAIFAAQKSSGQLDALSRQWLKQPLDMKP
ncbi:transporter substrate-binding domain-containing protein (plasmid) [Paraburkholderia sp. PREW-6R]|uniref:transporter substrate-binding domain-containing protein n=1 Tax=Paraburkholderia sp. PREW-6R TaxID=3141544 RepID=UPI0031F52C44